MEAERILWLPYAVLPGGVYYELVISPSAARHRRVLGFTRVSLEPSPGRPFRGCRLEPRGDPQRVVEDVLGASPRGSSVYWDVEVEGRRGLLWVARRLAERLWAPLKPPRVVARGFGLEEVLAERLIGDIKRLVGVPRVEAVAYRPFVLEDGALVDVAGLGDGHDRVLTWLVERDGGCREALREAVEACGLSG